MKLSGLALIYGVFFTSHEWTAEAFQIGAPSPQHQPVDYARSFASQQQQKQQHRKSYKSDSPLLRQNRSSWIPQHSSRFPGFALRAFTSSGRYNANDASSPSTTLFLSSPPTTTTKTASSFLHSSRTMSPVTVLFDETEQQTNLLTSPPPPTTTIDTTFTNDNTNTNTPFHPTTTIDTTFANDNTNTPFHLLPRDESPSKSFSSTPPLPPPNHSFSSLENLSSSSFSPPVHHNGRTRKENTPPPAFFPSNLPSSTFGVRPSPIERGGGDIRDAERQQQSSSSSPQLLRSEHQRLKKELSEQEDTIQDWLVKIERLQNVKKRKDEALHQARVGWESERTRLMNMLANRTALCRQREVMESELKQARTMFSNSIQDQKQLESEVEGLEGRIEQIRDRIRLERRKVSELSEAHAQVQYAVRLEERKYQHDRQQVMDRILESKMELWRLETKVQKERKRLKDETRRLLLETNAFEADEEDEPTKKEPPDLQQQLGQAKGWKDLIQNHVELKEEKVTATEGGGGTTTTKEQATSAREGGEGLPRVPSPFFALSTTHHRQQDVRSTRKSNWVQQVEEEEEEEALELENRRKAYQNLLARNTLLEIKRQEQRNHHQDRLWEDHMAVLDSEQRVHEIVQSGKGRFHALRRFFGSRIEFAKRMTRYEKKEWETWYERKVTETETRLETRREEVRIVHDQRQKILHQKVQALKEEGVWFLRAWDELELREFQPRLARLNTRIVHLEGERLEGLLKQRKLEQEQLRLEGSYRILLRTAWNLAVERYKTFRQHRRRRRQQQQQTGIRVLRLQRA